jgi:hypothetical protein
MVPNPYVRSRCRYSSRAVEEEEGKKSDDGTAL